jgi:hypothetical protein
MDNSPCTTEAGSLERSEGEGQWRAGPPEAGRGMCWAFGERAGGVWRAGEVFVFWLEGRRVEATRC